MNPLELVVRGTAMYWVLFLLFRFVLRRDVGSIAIADVLLLVLADASQNAMAGGYETVSDGVELMAALREQGVEHVEDVKLATMESDGNISVIKNGA